MRITHNMMADTTLRNLNTVMSKLDKLENQLTSGQRISSPSDDPIGTAAAMDFRSTLQELDQYTKNVDSANSWLEATDTALDSVTQVLHRARELAVQGSSDTMTSDGKRAIAAEVSQLLNHAVDLGNSTYGGQFLFGGFKVSTKPFTTTGDPPTAVVYNGDSGKIDRQIDSRSTVTVNLPGDQVFNGILQALIGLRDDLNSGDSRAVSSRITALDSAIDSTLTVRSEVGARINRLNDEKGSLETLKTNITGLLSKVQDVDMADAITQYTTQQDVYKAALAAGARAIQPSLLDYLR